MHRVTDSLELDEIISISEDSETEETEKKATEKAVEGRMKESESQYQAGITDEADFSEMVNEKALEEEGRNVLKQGEKMQTRASEILTKDSELAIAMKISMKEPEKTIHLRSKGMTGENFWSNLEASALKRQASERDRETFSFERSRQSN